ncbi:MAG: aa3-type cytochrome oxidase subunit IV [Candidatus Limnocylindrales bacterium]
MEEIRYFGRLAIYALLVGGAYWFLSYEPAGTVLLIGFGLATGAAFVVLRRGVRQEHGGAGSEGGTATSEAPFADETGPVPTRSGAPLAVGFGIATVALAGAFGPWFLIAGAVPLVLGAVDWLRAAERELALRSSTDDDAPGEAAHGGTTAERPTAVVEVPAAEVTEAG